MAWTDTYRNLGTLDDVYADRIAIESYVYQCYKVRFEDSGEAGFYSNYVDVDVIGYITLQDYAYDTTTGDIDNYIVRSSVYGEISATFTVSSNTDYYFWIRVSDPTESGTVRFSIDPPSGGGGGGGGNTWNVDDWGGSRIVSPGSTISFVRGEPAAYTLSRVPLYFGSAGNYIISAIMPQTLYAYLTTDTSYDDTDGEPDGTIIGSDTTSGTGFSFNVSVSNGTQYYLWVRTDDGSSGDSSFTVEFADGGGGGGDTWTLSVGSFDTVTSLLQESKLLDTSRIYRYTVQFSTSGTATFYSTGNQDTIGYISSTYSSFDDSTGEPYSYDAYDDQSGTGDNFSINNFSVTANTTYYFWFRQYSANDSGYATICIQPPSGPTPPQPTTGGCQIYINGSWQHAKPYIYLNGGWQPATPYIYLNGSWTPCT